MATQRNTSVTKPWFFSTTQPQFSRVQQGWNGDHRSVYPYKGHTSTSVGYQRNTVNGAYVGMAAGASDGSVYEFYSRDGLPYGSQSAYNKAYGKMREAALGEQSQLGVTFAEWKQSLGMVTNGALRLTKAARALKKGRFADFVKALGVKPKGKHRGKVASAAHQASSLWLEYWFGWSATLGDIYAACDVMQQPVPGGLAKGFAKSSYYEVTRDTKNMFSTQSGTVRIRVQAEVYLDNPNLFLLNQLGLANPAAVAWELIPFSFLVDWCFDVGSFFESFTDFLGCRVVNPCSTFLLKSQDSDKWLQSYMTTDTQWRYSTAMIRRASIPRPIPNLNVTGNLGQSLTRTASAVSLLTQTLLSMKR